MERWKQSEEERQRAKEARGETEKGRGGGRVNESERLINKTPERETKKEIDRGSEKRRTGKKSE